MIIVEIVISNAMVPNSMILISKGSYIVTILLSTRNIFYALMDGFVFSNDILAQIVLNPPNH